MDALPSPYCSGATDLSSSLSWGYPPRSKVSLWDRQAVVLFSLHVMVNSAKIQRQTLAVWLSVYVDMFCSACHIHMSGFEMLKTGKNGHGNIGIADIGTTNSRFWTFLNFEPLPSHVACWRQGSWHFLHTFDPFDAGYPELHHQFRRWCLQKRDISIETAIFWNPNASPMPHNQLWHVSTLYSQKKSLLWNATHNEGNSTSPMNDIGAGQSSEVKPEGLKNISCEVNLSMQFAASTGNRMTCGEVWRSEFGDKPIIFAFPLSPHQHG